MFRESLHRLTSRFFLDLRTIASHQPRTRFENPGYTPPTIAAIRTRHTLNEPALSLAIATMSRWKSLKQVAFSAEENSSAISNEDGLALQVGEPLSSLESFIMLGPCLSSPSVDKPLSTISTASKGRLRPTQIVAF